MSSEKAIKEIQGRVEAGFLLLRPDVLTLLGRIADLERERDEALPYMHAVREAHNGYSQEARKVMPGLKEPETPAAAIQSLVEEASKLGATGTCIYFGFLLGLGTCASKKQIRERIVELKRERDEDRAKPNHRYIDCGEPPCPVCGQVECVCEPQPAGDGKAPPPCCGNCRYYHANGTCRVHAPTVPPDQLGSAYWGWPRICDGYWCGEYAPKEDSDGK